LAVFFYRLQKAYYHKKNLNFCAMKLRYVPAVTAIFGLIFLLPYMLLGFFNVPASDDYLYARWQNDWGTVDANITCYVGWGGRYFSNLMLTTCNPLAYSSDYKDFLWLYQLHSIALLFGLIAATFLWIKVFLSAVNQSVAITFTLVGLSLALMGNVAEFLYWMAGSYTYCYGLIFALMAIYYLYGVPSNPNPLRFSASSTKLIIISLAGLLFFASLFVFRKPLIVWLNVRPGLFFIAILMISLACLIIPFFPKFKTYLLKYRLFLCSVCLFLAMGSNEVYAFILCPFIALLLVIEIWENRRISWSGLLLFFISTIAAGFNLFAPSTFARQKLQTDKATFDIANFESLARLLDYFSSIPFLFLFFLGLFLLFPTDGSTWRLYSLKNKPLDKHRIMYHSIFAVLLVIYLSVFLPVFLSVLAGPIPERTKNPLFFLSVLVLLIPAQQLAKNLKFKTPVVMALAFIFISLIGFYALPFPKNYFQTVTYLSSGNARRSIELDKIRFQQIASCQSDTCFISGNSFLAPGVKSAENAVFFNDPVSWKRYKDFSFATYFGKKSIIVRK